MHNSDMIYLQREILSVGILQDRLPKGYIMIENRRKSTSKEDGKGGMRKIEVAGYVFGILLFLLVAGAGAGDFKRTCVGCA